MALNELVKAYTALLTPDKRKARAKSVISIDGNLMVTINSPAWGRNGGMTRST